MEEILRSIRHLLSRDLSADQMVGPDVSSDHNVSDHNVSGHENLNADQGADHFRRPATPEQAPRQREPVAVDPVALERLLADTLRPMLAEWLDRHLPALVERLVREEIQTLSLTETERDKGR